MVASWKAVGDASGTCLPEQPEEGALNGNFSLLVLKQN